MANVAVYLTPPGMRWITEIARESPDSETAIVTVGPSSNNFNDFGTQAAIELYLTYRGQAARVSAKMILKRTASKTTEMSTSKVFDGLLAGRPVELAHALREYEFLAAIASRKDYRMVVTLLGPALAREALVAIHDTGTLQLYDPGNADLRALRELPAFGQSLLRFDEAFVAAFDVATSLSSDDDPSPTDNISFRACAPQLENEQGLLISFDHNVLEKNRICVLIGENGVGKTHVLNNVATMFGAGDTTQAPSGASFRPRKVLQIPSPLDQDNDERQLPRLTISQHPASERGWRSITGKIARFVRGVPDDNRQSDFVLLKRALSPFFDFDHLALPVREAAPLTFAGVLDRHGRRYVRSRDYEFTSEGRRTEFFGYIDTDAPPAFIKDDRIFALSSGERALLGLAVIILHDIGRGDLVLLDEPELSLHPRMIAELMRLLGLILNAREAYCVIATHSIYVIRETPSDAVHVLQRQAGSKTADYFPMLATLGAGLTELSNVVFDDVHIREYFTERIEAAVERTAQDSIGSLLSEIRRLVGETGIMVMNKALEAQREGARSNSE
jgi:predicted ATPase